MLGEIEPATEEVMVNISNYAYPERKTHQHNRQGTLP